MCFVKLVLLVKLVNMAKRETKTALTLDTFSDICNEKAPDQMGLESLGLKSETRPSKGAAAGCKPGYIRHTYVLPQTMIDQIKAVAHYFSCTEVSAAEQLLQKGLDAVRKKHGKKALTLQNKQSLFK